MKLPKFLRSSARSLPDRPLFPRESSGSSSDSSASLKQRQPRQGAPMPSHQGAPLPPQIEELHDAFRRFDTNGDGRISMAELGGMLRSLGEAPTEEELRLMLREADTDGDGYVGLEEFVRLHTARGAATPDELRAAFDVFDADENGFISAEELLQVMIRLGDANITLEDCSRMICVVDADGDGRVDFEEFKRMMGSGNNISSGSNFSSNSSSSSSTA